MEKNVSGSIVQVVPGYSDGLAPDFHRLPAGQKPSIPVSLLLDSMSQESRVASQFPPIDRHLTFDGMNTLHRRWFTPN